jgi:hypothetical protein
MLLLVALLLAAVAPARADARRVWIGEPRSEGGHLVLPLQIDDFSGIVAGDIDLRFDAGRTTVVRVRATELLAGFALDSNPVGDILKIAFASARPTTGSGALLEIVVEETGTTPYFGFAMVSLFFSNGDEVKVVYEMAATAITQDQTAAGVGAAGAAPLRAYPNPFNAQVRLAIELTAAATVRLEVFDLAGQRVRSLTEGEWPAGVHEVAWDGREGDGRGVGSGIYVVRYTGPQGPRCTRVALLR